MIVEYFAVLTHPIMLGAFNMTWGTVGKTTEHGITLHSLIEKSSGRILRQAEYADASLENTETITVLVPLSNISGFVPTTLMKRLGC